MIQNPRNKRNEQNNGNRQINLNAYFNNKIYNLNNKIYNQSKLTFSQLKIKYTIYHLYPIVMKKISYQEMLQYVGNTITYSVLCNTSSQI